MLRAGGEVGFLQASKGDLPHASQLEMLRGNRPARSRMRNLTPFLALSIARFNDMWD